MSQVITILGARDVTLSWVRYVGDEPQRLRFELSQAFSSGDWVFCCGGIGATPDDHTRQCAASALGLPLVLHPEAQARIVSRMREVAAQAGESFNADRPDNLHRLNMGVFPQGASIIPNPYNHIPGFFLNSPGGAGGVFFVPGFPVMAWPMIEWVLDVQLSAHLVKNRQHEQSLIVLGTMESLLTPLMNEVEALYPGVKIFSLPSVDHVQWGPHIELGVKGSAELVSDAYAHLRTGLGLLNVELGPELVR